MSAQQSTTRPDAVRTSSQPESQQHLTPTTDLVDYAKSYARQKPEVAALWCFGLGFVLGWKIKPW